ncbi:MAG: hypothetical protein WC619_04865 [Patescibacteria group bacterium]
MAKKKKQKQMDNCEAIKRLLILQLISQEVSTNFIGKVLGVDGSTIRKMVPQLDGSKKKK